MTKYVRVKKTPQTHSRSKCCLLSTNSGVVGLGWCLLDCGASKCSEDSLSHSPKQSHSRDHFSQSSLKVKRRGHISLCWRELHTLFVCGGNRLQKTTHHRSMTHEQAFDRAITASRSHHKRQTRGPGRLCHLKKPELLTGVLAVPKTSIIQRLVNVLQNHYVQNTQAMSGHQLQQTSRSGRHMTRHWTNQRCCSMPVQVSTGASELQHSAAKSAV